jgi:decaprenylphospho-beta-D-erythro-pentofuranosid-2-ulose 2-reductase
MKHERAIVVGATSGIGREIACQLAASGCAVVAIGRREDRLRELERLGLPITSKVHDVRQTGEIESLFEECCRLLGGLDLIVYCAGVMPSVALDEFNFEKDSAMIDVNFRSAVAWLNLAAARFGNVGSGSIVGIGSVAGDRGRRGQPVYNASKAALHTYLEALRNRLTRKGVSVVTIKPGPTETEMTANLGLAKMSRAKDVAAFTLKKLDRPGEHYVKAAHRVIFAMIRLVPGWMFRRLKI